MCYIKPFTYFALTAMASYAAYCMQPDKNPFGFASCGVGIIYGIFGLVGGHDCEMCIVRGVVEDLLDFAALGLMSIEIAKSSCISYAMVHSLFLIPLLLDLIAKLFGDEEDDATTQTLKHVNNLANIASLLYLAFEKENYWFAGVAASSLMAHSGMLIGGKCRDPMWDVNYIMFHCLLYFSSTIALAECPPC